MASSSGRRKRAGLSCARVRDQTALQEGKLRLEFRKAFLAVRVVFNLDFDLEFSRWQLPVVSRLNLNSSTPPLLLPQLSELGLHTQTTTPGSIRGF